MKIIEKLSIAAKKRDGSGVTVAFLGDSVTQGCFEIYTKNGEVETVFDQRNAYSRSVSDMLSMLYPCVPVNVINAGRSGDRAKAGAARLQRDVLRHRPDLVVVCYGLNDCRRDEGSVDTYRSALGEIFSAVREEGAELIFMTPNMMNTEISAHLSDPALIKIAVDTQDRQNAGILDRHIEAAKSLCLEMGVPVCDCYEIWKRMHSCGVSVTELLANKVNHPTREMQRLFAYELVKTMFEVR